MAPHLIVRSSAPRASVGCHGWARVSLVACALLMAACATKTAPPALPAALKYPEFIAPSVPGDLQQLPGAARVDAGWRYLQNDQLGRAASEFAAAVKRSPGLYPARAGEGYVALARQKPDQALTAFDAALSRAPAYVPALVGRGQSLLALKRDADALAALEAALAADPSLTNLRSRVELLRFRSLQDVIEAARAAAAAGRRDEARAAYARALQTSPDSAFLHRELGAVERQAGDANAALQSFRKAVELDPSDAQSLVQVGELLEAREDFAGAEAAYRRAAADDPALALDARIAAAAEKAREAALPAEFRAIASSSQITRGELAALIGVRLEDVLRAAPARQAVVTDTRTHWAAPWITAVVRAGVIDPFENHTFQPRDRVRRVDLAAAVSRLVTLMAARDPELKARLAAKPEIADVTPGHLSYQAVSTAVASGVVPLLDGQRFQVSRPVSGAEAVATVDRLRRLAADARRATP